MMWRDLLVAVALVLVFEGILPFMRPNIWRNFMVNAVQQPDKSLRVMGLISMLLGVGLLYAIRN